MFTSKERDSETGLDFFGARYFSSAQGRFTSTDPLPWLRWQRGNSGDRNRFYAFISNPQNLNLYAYVGGNPLSRTDPTGMYTCDGSKEQCQTIKNALDTVRKADSNLKEGSAQRKQLDAILKFYGKEGEKNGVNVNFAKLDGAVAQTGTSSFLGTGLFKTTTVTFDTGALSKFGNAGQGESVAHEGAHGVDQQAGWASSNKRWDIWFTEYHAYQSESYVDRGLGVRSESDGGNPVWAPGMSDADSVRAIRSNATSNTAFDCKNGGCTE